MSTAATFGWEVNPFVSGYGVAMQVEWVGATTAVDFVELDISAITTGAASANSTALMLVQAAITTGTPSYTGNEAYFILPNDSNFGSVVVGDNPKPLTVGHDGNLRDIGIAAVNMKFPLISGQVTSDHRHVRSDLPSGLTVSSGYYFVFRMDYSSPLTVELDAEMQVVIGYG